MGAQVSTQQRSSDHGEVLSVHSLDKWNTQFQNSKTSNKLMVIDFSAAWCGPCKFIEPAVHDLAVEFTDVDFIKIDIDELPDVAKDFDVQAMPTFVLLKKGKERDRLVGVKKDELHRLIEKHRF
ncbi:putative monodehydroascorbate reductase (NADH) [Helianthus annuus]|uniref:Monodehydroascorbate reductase (NADH) n=1 Tax=Helianthus annuus TaxID=4232 RepID=A0A251VBM7_HELAN|nr:thioredoxin H2 [Helianthus annuus]KAF5779617.1 putative monodehydroascorbate reductase (NADH) [Helianthus annuus]KAJ0490881.1 putative monodehydroascorbate reductase (NADH) [Helianthus annuus]KAJ0495218.1 putative monodehydroascorbate reductase (NADH) [Helianthus annuus]KAJ0506785.1 putative monodehydroascorbate reductase (NADH) [Helianthus annuus]KAJ0676462.1 putative monodehydroascorbate reductase (NADH) [Helianthus annuus]